MCGVIHIHTTFSDGSVDYPELIAAGRSAGLDFVVVNDHMTLKGKEEGLEGFAGDLLVVVGYEHHDSNNTNHYLVFGTDTVLEEQKSVQKYIDDVKRKGGIGFLAHPLERRHYFKRYPPYPWTEWSVKNYDGIEIWNQMSEWVENLKRWRSYIRVFYPRRFLISIAPELCAKWDEVNRERFVAGIGGVDAHTWKIRAGIISMRIFPIKVELKGIRTHLYLQKPFPRDDWGATEKMFIAALRDGHGFISNYRRGDAKGTRIYMQLGNGECIAPGKPETAYSPPSRLHVELPVQAEIRLIRNGMLFDCEKSSHTAFQISQTGVYRIEVYRRGRAWIYSNPFPVGSYPF
jgi:hypothetical protein